MSRTEKTSPRVARIAARILAIRSYKKSQQISLNLDTPYGPGTSFPAITWGDLCALAGSCLTQTPDKPKRKRK